MAKDEITQAEVERILRSQTFRNSEVLRVLLRFLAEKSVSGDADQLKEYTIGIDALGKPPTYDPRQDSGVRIQVGRLRQKLAEYYRVEGKDDPAIIDVPKGQFKITCEPASPVAEPPPAPQLVVREEVAAPSPVATPPPSRQSSGGRLTVILLGTLLFFTAGWGVYTAVQLSAERRLSVAARAPELTELWKPFLVANRPLIVVVATPLFVGFPGAGNFRDTSINSWEDAQNSPRIEGLRKFFKSPAIVPQYYVALGEISSVFRLGKILNSSPVSVSLSRSADLSQQQLADSNVIFVGSPRVFGDQVRGLPAPAEFVIDSHGVQNLHPRAGEPTRLDDHFPTISDLRSNVPDNGELYAVVTHEPGILGTGDILSFSANHSPGILAAVEWLTEPGLAKTLLAKLRKENGEIPRYYQVVFHAKYKGVVPTETTYVMHRELSSGTK